ncbi:MAG TPA: M20/M25/M40 family metallo-hydrolase [Pyrinomonadaceae bacterium]|nr:M20/M25/M40 family metallo-hydrolase [Pyrinomonadaceae bacterium]
MTVRRYTAIVLLLIFAVCPLTLFSQTAAQPAAQTTAQTPAPDANDPIARIRDEGMNRSQVMQTLSYLSDVIGPRLTASPGMKRANEWTRDQLTKWGLQNAHLEAWGPFGRGWTLKRFSAQVSEPTAFPVIAYPKAWSPSIAPLTADVVYVDAKTEADLEKYKGKLKGKIVLTSPMREVPAHFDPLGTRLNEKDLLTLADAPEPRQGGPGRANFANAASAFRTTLLFTNTKMRFFDQEGAAVLIDPSRGDGGTIFVQSAQAVPPATEPTPTTTGFPRGIPPYDKSQPKVIPQLVMAIEHYNRIVRMLQAGEPVKMSVDLAVAWQDQDLNGYNTVAEIPGADLKDEIVMLGGHMDSWHSGTGATDNGAGVSVAMEAVRIIQALGLKPRRTIRVALWTGEEQGLLGSRAYVAEHFGSIQTPTTSAVPATGPNSNGMGGGAGNGNGNGAALGPTLVTKPEYDKLSGYFNLDNGTGKIRGVYLQGNESVRTIFRQWLAPFRDMGAATLSISNTGGTDHLSFDGIGLPGFQFIQDEIEYDTRTHHSNQDVFDRIQADDMKEAATIMAAFVYQTAMRDQKLPRKPAPGTR